MARLYIEFEPPINAAQVKALQEITHLNPSKRGREPVIRGGVIFCGYLTARVIVERLKEAGIGIRKIARPQSGSAEQVLSFTGKNGGSLPALKPDETPVTEQALGGIIFDDTGNGEETTDPLYEAYWERLLSLPPDRALALHDALSRVTDTANDLCPEKGVTLRPYHLVDFDIRDESSGTSVSANLGRLNKVSAGLVEGIWGHIRSFERRGDTQLTDGMLDERIVDVLTAPELCDGLFSLAQSYTQAPLM